MDSVLFRPVVGKASAARSRGRAGQSVVEYAVFTAVVVAALVTMSVYVRRAIQANLKMVEGQVNAEAIKP